MQIIVSAKQTGTPINNFWNNIHFHPTDAVEDRWGKAILDQVAEDHVAQYVRLHTMFEDIVTRGEDGKLRFDYMVSDRRLDYMNSKGFKLLLCFDFMPACMSQDQRNCSNLRYKNKTFNRSAPSNWGEWASVCENYTRHLVERYGLETVSTWLFHCWNEPDSGYWINKKGNDECDATGDTEKVDKYITLYDRFAEGILRVTDKIRIGGPSCAGSDIFIRTFLKHVKESRVKFDFLSVHCYSQGIYSNLPNVSFASPDNVMQRMHTLRGIANECGFDKTPILLDEFGIAGGGFLGIDRDPRMIFRETEYYSAFYMRLIDRILHSPELGIEKMMICLSGQDHVVKDFDGFRTFFTANGYAKPVYNGYRVGARLGNQILNSEIANADPHAGVIPTADEKGNIKIVLYSFENDFYAKIPAIPVHLKIDGINGKYLVRQYRIDKQYSNAYSRFVEMASPEVPTMYQRSEIADAGELTLCLPEEIREFKNEASFEMLLSQNGIIYLELINRR